MPPKKQATPTNRPSSQLPVYSPEWYKARHREGTERAETEKRKIDAATGNAPQAGPNNTPQPDPNDDPQPDPNDDPQPGRRNGPRGGL
jgi:hypothetical protein